MTSGEHLVANSTLTTGTAWELLINPDGAGGISNNVYVPYDDLVLDVQETILGLDITQNELSVEIQTIEIDIILGTHELDIDIQSNEKVVENEC